MQFRMKHSRYGKGQLVRTIWRRYPEGNASALQLLAIGGEFDEPQATATVNIPEIRLGKDELLIKDWSENEGMVQELVSAGIIEPNGHRYVPTGYVAATVAKLTPAGIADRGER